MIRSELRATVSSGFTRPPTCTGIFPNRTKSTSPLGGLDGNKLEATQSMPKETGSMGKNRFMQLPLPAAAAQNRRGDNRIEESTPEPRSRTPDKVRERSDCGRLGELSPNRPFETQLDKTCRRDNAADDSCKRVRRDQSTFPDRSGEATV